MDDENRLVHPESSERTGKAEYQLPKFEEYSIVWQGCSKNSEISHRFYVPEFDGYLPFFLWGADLRALQQKEKVELREEQLLEGILYGLDEFDHHPGFWHRTQDRNTYLYLLKVLENGFKYESREIMILNVAAGIRERNGNGPSRIVLEVGKNLVPQSSSIKSDLVLDLWAVLPQDGTGKELMEEIIGLVPQIKLNEINPNEKEVVCYYGLCATVLLGKTDNVQRYLEDYVHPNVTIRILKDNIKELLENPGSCSPADLRVG
jgi:hypothetical protein